MGIKYFINLPGSTNEPYRVRDPIKVTKKA